jgi:hypothetical protein
MASSGSGGYQNLDDRALVDYQRKVMIEQDKSLETIEQSVGNLKEAAVVMSQELTIQNALLEDMHIRVDETNERAGTLRSRVSGFLKNTSTCKIWLIIVFALVFLVLILAYL